MGRIALPILHWYSNLKEELDVDGEDEDDSEMVSVNVVLAHLADWTDGRKLALARKNAWDADASIEGDADVHLDVAEQALEKLLGVTSREERKLHISLLGKLYFTAESDLEKLRAVSRLVDEAVDDKIAQDAPARNTLAKVQTSLDKLIMAHDQNRDASPAPSAARSMLDAGVEGAVDEQSIDKASSALSELDIRSTATTPAASPRKRTAGRSSQVPPRTSSEVEDERLLSPRKSSRRQTASRQPEPLEPVPDVEPEDQENQPPPASDPQPEEPASPTKKRRGRPARSTIAHIKTEEEEEEPLPPSEPAATAQSDLALRLKQPEPDESAGPDEPVKRRGRPPRVSAVGMGGGPARKSVRAGRRKVPEESAE